MLELDLLKYAIHKIHSDEQLRHSNYIQKSQKEISDAESELKTSEKKSTSFFSYTDEQLKLLGLKEDFLFALFDNEQQGKCTILHVAVDVGCKDVMEFLLDDVVHGNIQNSDGNISLHIAVSKGDREIVDMLLDKEPDFVDIKDSYGDTPLHIAVFNGDREMIDMSIINGDSSALLHVPDSQGNIEIIEILLDKKPAFINIHDKNGNIPLHLAVLKKKIKGVWTLLTKKAYGGVSNKTFCTPLDYVNRNMEIIEFFTDMELFSKCTSLIENNKTQSNIETETQVEIETQIAMQKNDIDKDLINRKATIDNTSLCIADCKGDKKIVLVLRDKGQGLNIQNKYGDTTSCIGISKGNRKVVTMSLSKELDLIKRQNRYPLNNAKQDRKTEIMSVMLAKEKERSRESHIPCGDIPVDSVCQGNRTKVMKFFTGLFGFTSSTKNNEIQNKQRTEKQITVKSDIDVKHTCVTEQHALKNTFLKKEMAFSQKLNPIPLQRQNLNSKDQSILVHRGMETVNIDAIESMSSLKKKKSLN